jgi:2,3-bisphosphoglycerate-independent phosphoglycerate mutase
MLLILDGWGHAPAGPGNAFSQARTPNIDGLLSRHPVVAVECAGEAVGLPRGYMGNSEVGHVNIGAGRIVYQDFMRINKAIESGDFYRNNALETLASKLKESGGSLHLMGLVSDGGVHSHLKHLYALLEWARDKSIDQVYIHAFMDGRDTPPRSGRTYMEQVVQKAEGIGKGEVASVSGRYWAMDRDKRWDRTARAYDCIVHGRGPDFSDPVAAVQEAYDSGENDEFITPRVVADDGKPKGRINDGDAVVFFNFRPDRARQLTTSLFAEEFEHFDRGQAPVLAALVTMTRYDETYPVDVAFPPETIDKPLGEVLSDAGLTQLRIAETEKYAHVTYFLNCGREEPYPGEERAMIPSPRQVPTYDHKPEMSAFEVTERLLQEWGEHDMCICNLANLDMVGHTGIMEATVAACEAVDDCVGRIADKVLSTGGVLLLTADHGNSDEMLDADGEVQTAHSTNPVPFVFISAGQEGPVLREDGKLGDIAPTVLEVLGIEKPGVMTGQSLIKSNEGQGWLKSR